MPLVFLHGVNTRAEGSSAQRYQSNVLARDALFRQIGLRTIVQNPTEAHIFNPYWGNLGAHFAWDLKSLPGRGAEQFGPSLGSSPLLLGAYVQELAPDEELQEGQGLALVARRSLTEAIDLLWSCGAEQVQQAGEAKILAVLAQKTLDFVQHNPNPDWLSELVDDRDFLTRLSRAVDAWQPAETLADEEVVGVDNGQEIFGGTTAWETLQAARRTLQSATAELVAGTLGDMLRHTATEFMGRFIGDVFTYLNQRGNQANPGPVVTKVVEQLEQARAAITPDDPRLVVVAHSMGGNIMYDVLTHFHPNIPVDAFFTVGSQVAFFEELKLFRNSSTSIPNPQADKVPKPANVQHWINVYDLSDMFAFAAGQVFAGAQDFEFNTRKGLILAHSSYFSTPTFHERFAIRLGGLFP